MRGIFIVCLLSCFGLVSCGPDEKETTVKEKTTTVQGSPTASPIPTPSATP